MAESLSSYSECNYAEVLVPPLLSNSSLALVQKEFIPSTEPGLIAPSNNAIDIENSSTSSGVDLGLISEIESVHSDLCVPIVENGAIESIPANEAILTLFQRLFGHLEEEYVLIMSLGRLRLLTICLKVHRSSRPPHRNTPGSRSRAVVLQLD